MNTDEISFSGFPDRYQRKYILVELIQFAEIKHVDLAQVSLPRFDEIES